MNKFDKYDLIIIGAGASGLMAALSASRRHKKVLIIEHKSKIGLKLRANGGGSLQKINPKTLESKLIKNLYFAGEVIDLDGPCGGFNLQWAFSSEYLVGTTV